MKDKHQNISFNLIPYALLTALTILVCWLFAGRHGVFASSVDWISQHSVFPGYFRRQFYETGELFPEFAASLGGGQNIYNFSYYGLLSPVVLLSYLFPFVKISDYLMAASIISLAASVLLLYHWLRSRSFSREICLAVSILFLLAGPMVFQSCRHIMFVNYMPFLYLALSGMDRYVETGRPGLYITAVFLMILTSFYFSIGGIFVLLVYGASRCKKISIASTAGLVLPAAAAVLASGILLVPTAYALLSGRGSSQSFSLADLLLPDFSVTRFAYSGYGIGLTPEIFGILLMGLFYRNRQERLLSAFCLLAVTLPFFSWLLNGGLYIREKSLIPFLPLLCYLAALWLEKQKQGNLPLWAGLAAHALGIAVCLLSLSMHKSGMEDALPRLLFVQGMCVLPCFLLCKKSGRIPLLLLPSMACLILHGNDLGYSGKLLEKNFYEEVTNSGWDKEIAGILEKEPGLYRLEQAGTGEEKKANINRVFHTGQWISSVYSSVCQENYQAFRKEIFQTDEPFRNILMQPVSENPLFQKLMGVKYVVEKPDPSGGFSVETQEAAAPVIYATSSVISQDAYRSLSFPDSQTALTRQAVVEEDARQNSLALADSGNGMIPSPSLPDLPPLRQTDVFLPQNCPGIQKSSQGYDIRSGKNISLPLCFDRADARDAEQLLYLQFDVENHNKRKDFSIDLAGVRNKLSASYLYYNDNVTFTYVIRIPAGQTAIDALFSAGDYSVSNIRSFLGDASVLTDKRLYQSEFYPDREKTKGSHICGEITVKEDGYLVTSIPYDRGFEILIDESPVKTRKVNTAFLGASIDAGFHKIDIIYHAPGMTAGKILSFTGVCLWIAMALAFRARPNRSVLSG